MDAAVRAIAGCGLARNFLFQVELRIGMFFRSGFEVFATWAASHSFGPGIATTDSDAWKPTIARNPIYRPLTAPNIALPEDFSAERGP
jgi:hypothetical protein